MTSDNNNNRVLSRRGARELTAEEQAQVSGGDGTFVITGGFRKTEDVIRD